MDWKKLLFSAEGRIRRQDFWIGWLILFGVNVVLGLIPVLGWLASLATIYCFVCIGAKRLHDMGRSGWLMLIPVVACVVLTVVGGIMFGAGLASTIMNEDRMSEGAFVAGILGSTGALVGFVSLAGLVNLAFLIWVGATPGQPGDNRFGSPPPGSEESSATVV